MPIIIDDIEQGTPEWIAARVGRITASNFHKLLVGGQGKTRQQYIMEVASEALTGIPAERVSTRAMDRGIILEPYARQAYEAVTGSKVRQIGLAYLDDNRMISCSPDGLVGDKGIEIKCQAPKAHLAAIMGDINPKQFDAQIQGNMWIMDCEEWDYVSFCPEFKVKPIWVKTVHRDQRMIDIISGAAFDAAEQVIAIINSLTGDNPSQNVIDICYQAIETLEILTGKDEVIE